MTETNPYSSEHLSPTAAQDMRSEPVPLKVEVIEVDVESTQTDGLTLAQSLRQQNQSLHQTIAQLEQALADAQQNLQIQTKRVRNAEKLISQQTEELQQTPDTIERLVGELEASQQTIQQQQSIINHLSAQLEKTQAQFAYLERECALLQEEKTGKTHQLLTVEKHMRELQSRLHRQQRYTLQYKTALEQISESEVKPPAKVIPLIPKNATIQPWTNVETETSEKSNAWIEQASEAENQDRWAVSEPDAADSMDEFLAELETDEPILEAAENSTPPKNWSFSIVPSSTAWKKTPTKSVDLPTFL
jgi:chromosome segregation ATPase